MIAELILIEQLLFGTEVVRSTPPNGNSSTPAKIHTKDSRATLGGGTLNLLHPRAPVTLKPEQVAERYYRRPKGLN
jgi:hypothetical protein